MNLFRKRLAILPVISLFLCLPLLAQDKAELLFDNATTFMKARKYKEALTDLNTLIESYTQTDWAPKALLTMGNYYLDIEQNYDKAIELFGRIQREYNDSAEAPAAYFFKATIVEERGESIAALESAVADLIRMNNIYPGNAWHSGAQFLFGTLALRLKDYPTSLRYLQNLEFSDPKSPLLPKALLLSAKVAYFKGQNQQAALTLARLQSRYPNSPEAEIAADNLRLLDRFSGAPANYTSDPTFFAATPKSYTSPSLVAVTPAGMIAIRDQKGTSLLSVRNQARANTVGTKDVVDFAITREGRLVLAYENRLVFEDGQSVVPSLPFGSSNLRDIRSAALDGFGRILVVDGDARDLIVYSKEGKQLHAFSMSKPKMVRCYAGDAWVLGSDGDTLHHFDGSFKNSGQTIALSSIVDYCFDAYGNLYVLADKGYSVSIYTRATQRIQTFNLKNGTFPIKQAQSIAVDASGALYLADRRGGSIQRIH